MTLEKLKELLASGVITQEEYDELAKNGKLHEPPSDPPEDPEPEDSPEKELAKTMKASAGK